MKQNLTSYAVVGTGIAVTLIGRVVGGNLGAGITGFGLAHVTLGILDHFRPGIRLG